MLKMFTTMKSKSRELVLFMREGLIYMYRAITINRGSAGWGGPLTIKPTENCYKVISVTGGGIHPVAQKIAEMTGGEAIDGFPQEYQMQK